MPPPAAVVRRELSETVLRIGQLSPDKFAASTNLFNALKTGVNHVASGKESLEDVLDDLEPKVATLAFLVGLHQQKRIYRKQINHVFQVLTQVDSWTQALRGDEALYQSLPGDLLVVVDGEIEAPAAEPEAPQAPAAEPEAPQAAPVAEPEAPQAPAPAEPAAPPAQSPQPQAPAPAWRLNVYEQPVREKPAKAPAPAEPAAPPAQSPRPEAPAPVEPPAPPAQGPQLGSAGGLPTASLKAPAPAFVPPARAASPRPAAVSTDEAVQASLERSMAAIAELSPGFREEPGSDAFGLLKRAVVHASGSRGRTPGELMDGLEPKGHVFRFLLEFHERKRLQRKNVAMVFSGLLQAGAWLDALGSDGELVGRLPPDLREPFDRERARQTAAPAPEQPPAAAPEQPAAPPEAPERCAWSAAATTAPVQEVPAPAPAGSPWGQNIWGPSEPEEGADGRRAAAGGSPNGEYQPSAAQVQDAINRARAKVEAAAAPPPPTQSFVVRAKGADELLAEGVAEIRSLRWSPASGDLLDIDAAADAYASFNRGVVKALASGASQEEREALEGVEPKLAVLEFLAAFSRQSKKHQSRVSVTMASLQKCKSWESFLSKNRSLQAAVQEPSPARESAPEAGRPAAARDDPSGGRKANRRSVLQQAAQALDSTIGENGLECVNGHPITKRKAGLRLHQKLEFWSVRNCDFCKEEILQNAVRWRCNEHCDFDVCESCYESAQRQGDAPLQKKSLSLGGPGLGVVQVEIPKEKTRKDPSGILFYEVEVTPVFSENSPPVYSVSRRYNEFEALNRNLGPEASKLGPTFPPKLWSKTESALEERRRGLSQWLQAAVTHTASSSGIWRELLRKFLRYDPERGK